MTGPWPGGLHHHGMHEFVVREAEVGTRVALAEDEEACMGFDFRLQAADLAVLAVLAVLADLAALAALAARDTDTDTDGQGDLWC